MRTLLRSPSARWWMLGVSLTLIAGLFAAILWRSTRAATTQRLRVGFHDSPPFYFLQQDGSPHGLAPNVLNEAARRAGVTLTWIQLNPDEPGDRAILSHQVDAAATMPVGATDPSVYISEPWLVSSAFLLFRHGTQISSAADVAGRRVAMVPFRLDHLLAARLLPHARLVTVPSPADQLRRLCDGSVDAALVDGRVGQALLLDQPGACRDIRLSYVLLDERAWSFGVGTRAEHRGLADRLRTEIDRMGDDGSLARIQATWSFGSTVETHVVKSMQRARLRRTAMNLGLVALGLALVAALWQVRRAVKARRRAEEEAGREERYRVLFERNLAGVFRTSLEGGILDCNDAFARMLGCESREKLLVHQAWEFYPDRESRERHLTRLRRDGTLANQEVAVRRLDGRVAMLLENSSLIDPRDGSPPFIEGTILDITRERELEDQYRQAQKLESVGLLAGGIAHDFNNALTAINGFAELLLNEMDENDRRREMVQEIAAAGRHAESLTRQLLAFSRRQVLQPKVLNLNLVIAEMQSLIRRTIGESIDLRTDLEPKLWHVKADPGQVQQILVNLAVNARDAMPDGGRLTLATANLEATPADSCVPPLPFTSPCVRLAVSDTGHGMDAETQRRAFEPFFTTKERGKGTGLGLPTVYGVVRQSGGEIRVRSEPGHGATFEIYLPRIDEGEIDLRDRPATQPQVRGSETVLVVEDQPDVRRFAAEVLIRHGYRVLQAEGADAAIRVCREQAEPIHLLLTDVVMPGMSGSKLAEGLKQEQPALKVLFMSGYTDNELRDNAEAANAGAFLQKPFTASSLAAKVRDVLDGAPPA